MRKRWLMIAAIIGIVLIGIVAVGPIMSNVETPDYEVIKAEGHIEIRQYAPMIVAEVQVKGGREDAMGDGFRLLADYIFGGNIAHKNIAMTAPVQQQYHGDDWQISFVMPAEYTMETLPKPLNNLVTLKRVPGKKFVVIIFSGRNSETNVKEHEKKLMIYIKAQNLSVTGSPKYAFYNPPWTLPNLRRNEVMVEIQG